MNYPAELIELVRDHLGREPKPHEVGKHAATLLRTAKAATTNADRARHRYEVAAAQATPADLEKQRRAIADRMGVHYHKPIVRPAGTIERARLGELVRVPDEVVKRSAIDAMTGIVGTPMSGGIPGVEKNADLYPYLARGLSYDSGEFTAFYRSDAVVREAVADIVGIISTARMEVQMPAALDARTAELFGVDRDRMDMIADHVNAELMCGQWGNFAALVKEILRIAMVNGADVHEFMFDAGAPLGRRIQAISPRLPNTWMRWYQDPVTGEAVAIEQTNPNGDVYRGASQLLDLSRCIHVAIDQDGDNFEGLSMLRPARAWDVLSFEVSAATILHWQRFGPGVPVIKRNAIGQASAGADQNTYESFATYANLSSAVLEVGAGVDVDLLQMQMDTGFVDIIDLCTKQKRIALRNSIAGMGTDNTGAYNFGDIKSQMFMKGLHSFCQPVEAGVNNLIRRYIDIYFGPQIIYPTLAISGFAARSPVEIIETQTKFAELVNTGVHTDEELAEIAAAADIVWSGRGSEADLSDEQAAETDPNQPDPTEPEQRDIEQPEGSTPPAAAQKAAALGRRARAKAADKWAGTIAELAISKAIAAGQPLSRLQLRQIESYFDEAAPDAPFEQGSPEWQEWHCMGGDAMAEWVGAELDPDPDPDPETRAPAKYDHIDFSPPKGVREAAQRALDVRAEKPASQRGMTPVGLARARDLANGRTVSPETARRMLAYFERHEVDKQGSTWDEQGKGWQAWNGWGGDAGFAWARKIVGQMNAADEGTDTRAHVHHEGCGCVDTRAAKRVEIIVSGRGGGQFATHRALIGAERSVAWADIQARKDLTARRITSAVEREQRAMRAEYMALAGPLIEAGDVAGLARIRLDYVQRFKDAILPALTAQSNWSARDMRAEMRDIIGAGWRPESQDLPQGVAGRIEATAAALAEQVQGRTMEELRNAGLALSAGADEQAVKNAGLGFGRTAAALVVQAVSTAANTARVQTAATQGPRIARAVYSAVMDKYTCPVCAAADGTEVEYGSDEYRALSPPNPQCNSVANSGVNMCQCIWVYEFEEPTADTSPDTETRAAKDRPTVRLIVGPPGAGKSTLAGPDAIDRDKFVLIDGRYRREGVAESLDALREAVEHGDATYVTCALSASSRATLRAEIEGMGARVECVEVTAPLEWLRLVNEDRGERQIPWDQWQHLIDAWEPVGDGEFDEVERVITA